MRSRPVGHPSAEEFLRQLILFIDSHGSELLSSKDAFKLQPRALEYLALRLEGLRELQRVKTSNPIRFLEGAVADLTDFLRMEKVQQFCSLVKHLKLYSSARDVRDPTPVDFSPFKSLVIIEIRGCDLSSICPRGVECLTTTVETIVCQDSLECLWHLLEPNRIKNRDARDYSKRWSKLTRLSCIYNDMKEIDTSMTLASNVTTVDLSRNQIFRGENLSDLTHLTALDLSFNRLVELGDISQSLGLRRLFLQSNGIASFEGIVNLERLEELDLRWNVISLLGEVAKLKTLSALRLISLAGNPISHESNYRHHVLACLLEWRDDVTLDGKPTSTVERRRASRITITTQGFVELNLTESNSASVPTPLSIWECFSPLYRPFRRPPRMASSASDAERPMLLEVNIPGPRLQKPVKRIVDLPDTSYNSPVEVRVDAVDTRTIPRTVVRGRTNSRDFTQFNDSYTESRSGAVTFA